MLGWQLNASKWFRKVQLQRSGDWWHVLCNKNNRNNCHYNWMPKKWSEPSGKGGRKASGKWCGVQCSKFPVTKRSKSRSLERVIKIKCHNPIKFKRHKKLQNVIAGWTWLLLLQHHHQHHTAPLPASRDSGENGLFQRCILDYLLLPRCRPQPHRFWQ